MVKLKFAADVSAADADAFRRAIAIMLRHREQIYRSEYKRRLATSESHAEIGRAAAISCQFHALGLRPWQEAPADVEPGLVDAPGYEQRRTAAAAALLVRLLAAGLSRFEPDPASAIERAEAAAAAEAAASKPGQ